MALVTTSAADMNCLLEQVSLFSEWSSMDLCVLKCEATAYDYKSNTELSVDTLHVGGKLLMPLAANKAFKYLGVCLTVHSDTSAEVAHVQQKTFDISTLLREHPHTPTQAENLFSTCVVPVFTYSGLLTAWQFNDLDNLLDQWGLLLKQAIPAGAT
eukprot:1616879-Rhodomonas_salina.2